VSALSARLKLLISHPRIEIGTVFAISRLTFLLLKGNELKAESLCHTDEGESKMQTFKNNSQRWVAMSTLGVMAAGSMMTLTPPAHAVSSKTWKKIAIGSAVVTGYGLIKRKRKVALIGAAATAGSYYMYRRARRHHR
jgi:hypothetical protein